MDIWTLDAETFFSDLFSLSRLTNEQYIRSSEFEVHGWAVRDPKGNQFWFERDTITQLKPQLEQGAILAHHAHFDLFILNHRYGIRPKAILCSLSMARLLIGNHLSVSLDSLAKHFGLAAKIVPYSLFKNKHWHELTPEVQQQVAQGALHDVSLTWDLFQILAKTFPPKEYVVVDSTVRMFTEPVLRADVDRLADIWEAEAKHKLDLKANLGVTADQLQSAEQFASLLRAQGVEPETKTSPKGNEIYAFAKTDPFMQDLLQDQDPIIRGLAEARLGEKSTFLQSRAETLGHTASRGAMPVYLFYCGAATTRWSGGDKVNYQNLDSELENCILPPEGYWAFAPDASQIEARLGNWLAGQTDKVEEFRRGEDPYVAVASRFYGRPINKKDHPQERQVGKVLELQCLFGSGAEKIRATLRNQAGILLSPEDALRARDAYRDTHPAVVDCWKACNRLIARLAGGEPLQFGPFIVETGKLYIPGEPAMLYILEYHRDEETPGGYWRRKSRYGWQKTFGSKIFENAVQYAHRIIITDALVRLAKLGYRSLSNKHDSLWFAIPKNNDAEKHREIILREMCVPPPWAPDLPLDAAGGLQIRFGKP